MPEKKTSKSRERLSKTAPLRKGGCGTGVQQRTEIGFFMGLVSNHTAKKVMNGTRYQILYWRNRNEKRKKKERGEKKGNKTSW